MSDEIPQPPAPRVLPFIGGIICGIVGALAADFVAIYSAGVIGQGGPAMLFYVCTPLVLAIGGIIAIVHVARAKQTPQKFFKLGVAAGVCVGCLLIGVCFVEVANRI